MTDIVQKLRENKPLIHGEDLDAAAYAIEQLRARRTEAERLLRLSYRFVATAYDGREIEASIHDFLANRERAYE